MSIGTHLATCVVCSCDDFHACPDGCSWVIARFDAGKGLCSACAMKGCVAVQVRAGSSDSALATALGYSCSSTCSIANALSGLAQKLFPNSPTNTHCIWEFYRCNEDHAVGHYVIAPLGIVAPPERRKKAVKPR